MSGFVQRVIALTKRPGETFGFFLRAEQGEEGHLVRCLDMGGAAQLAGMRDGDRILRVNGTFVDGLAHLQVRGRPENPPRPPRWSPDHSQSDQPLTSVVSAPPFRWWSW